MPTTTNPTTRAYSKRRRARPSRRSRPAQATGARILTLNIAAAAEPRAGRILRWLRGRGDDVIVLSETSGGPGTALLRDGLDDDGYSIFSATPRGERGVLLACRLPECEAVEQISVTVPCRAGGIVVDGFGLVVVGVYVPSRDRTPAKVARKKSFITSLLKSLRSLPPEQRERLVLIGDYNAVARHHHPSLPGFFDYEYSFHDKLRELGLSAAHEVKPYGSGHPHSWIGRTGIGYLYDYAHVGTGLHSRLERCQYLHGPRQQRLSDHAALAVRLRLD